MPYLLLLFLLLSSCAASNGGLNSFDIESRYRRGQYEEALSLQRKYVSSLSEESWEYLQGQLNLGLLLQSAGRYEESAAVLVRAQERVWSEDFISLTEEGVKFVVGDKFARFKLPEHEQILLQAEIMFSYLYAGKLDEALVENRLLEKRLERMRQKNLAFNYVDQMYVHYLSALIYEAQGKYDDALIDYERIRKVNPYYHDTLDRIALVKQKMRGQKTAEIIVIYQNGMAPYKAPHPYWPGISRYVGRINGALHAQIAIDGQGSKTTAVIMSVEDLALKLQWGKHQQLVLRDLGRKLAKEALLLPFDLFSGGILSRLAASLVIHAPEDPDLRTWDYLPKDVQTASFRLSPRVHRLRLLYDESRGDSEEREIRIRNGQMKFVGFRFGNSL